MSAAVERLSSWSAPKSRVGCDAEVLDACCGGRHWWWDKQHPLAVYMDERVVPLGNEWRAGWSCDPDIVGDFRAMPFSDETFQLVLFDPPHHIRRNLETKWSTRFYGALNPDTWPDDLRAGFAECWRVLAAGGTLVFKWSGDTSLCAPHFPAEPLVGTREKKGTSWFIFYKPALATESALQRTTPELLHFMDCDGLDPCSCDRAVLRPPTPEGDAGGS